MNRAELEKYIAENYVADKVYPWPAYPNFAIFRHKNNKKGFAFVMDLPKTTLGLQNDGIIEVVNLKCSPVMIGSFLYDYFMNNQVVYIEIDGNKGKAIVRGNECYTVEFEYSGGEIRNIVCGCYCTGACKHEFAAMLQLRETLNFVTDNYKEHYGNYFAAICAKELFRNVMKPATKAKISVY